MATKTITLEKPIDWFGKRLASVELREPTGGEYVLNGEPYVVVHNNLDGTWYSVEHPQIIKSYLDRCLSVENGAAIIGALTLKDAKSIKDALLSFFYSANSAISSPAATSSSST